LERLAVRIFSASPDLDNSDDKFVVVEVVNHTPVADTDAPALQPTQFPTFTWTRVVLQTQNRFSQAAEIWLVDPI